MSGARLAVDALATFRLTKLVIDDKLTEPLRARAIGAAYRRVGREAWYRQALNEVDGDPAQVVAQDAEPPKLAYLLTCPWCSGMYVAVAVVAARRLVPRAWAVSGEVLALSGAAGLAAESLSGS